MSTTVHLPKALLEQLDREADRRAMSRNHLITQLLSRAMEDREDWPRGLFEELDESALSEPKP